MEKKFTAGDGSDLIWRWNEAMAACGVKSSMGAQMEMLLTRRPPPDKAGSVLAMQGLGGERVTKAEALMGADALYSSDHAEIAPQNARKNQSRMDRMRVHESHSIPRLTTIAGEVTYDEQYYEPAFLASVARARRIDAALNLMDGNQVKVLYAIYGPARGDSKLNDNLRQYFGSLSEIAVVFEAADSEHGDIHKARNEVGKKCKDAHYVANMVAAAEALQARAHREYAKVRI